MASDKSTTDRKPAPIPPPSVVHVFAYAVTVLLVLLAVFAIGHSAIGTLLGFIGVHCATTNPSTGVLLIVCSIGGA